MTYAPGSYVAVALSSTDGYVGRSRGAESYFEGADDES